MKGEIGTIDVRVDVALEPAVANCGSPSTAIGSRSTRAPAEVSSSAASRSDA